MSVIRWMTNAFPLWVVICSLLALWIPEAFTWFTGPWIKYGLAVIMLGMGLTLTIDDFRAVVKMPRAAAIGIAFQFGIMPLLGWTIAYLLRLDEIDPTLAVGLILVACCPGGTASNVVCFLARANVALSVLMTMCSTLLAILMTPLLTKGLAGAIIEVDALGLCLTIAQVVLLPVIAGVMLNRFLPEFSRRVSTVSPLASVIAIVLIVASIIGRDRELILECNWRVLGAPALLHLGGFLLGYWAARLIRIVEPSCRTISIEVGMQNSGLGGLLASKHFPDTLAAVPCAISALYHCIIGSFVAAMWRRKGADNVSDQNESPKLAPRP
ncbi:MAG: bile acid:sodium symporter family protein [Verrucomicrobiota bacterium]